MSIIIPPQTDPEPPVVGGEILEEYAFSRNVNTDWNSAGLTIPNSAWNFVHPGAEYGDVIVEAFYTGTPVLLGSSSNWWVGLYRNSGSVLLSQPVIAGANGTSTNRKGASIYWAGLYSPGSSEDFSLIGNSLSANNARLEAYDWAGKYVVKRPAKLGTTITQMTAP